MATFQITGPDGKKYRVTGDTPEGAMQALRQMVDATPPSQQHPEFDPANVPGGVPGYDPKTGNVTPQYSMGGSAGMGAADTATFGFGDEGAASILSGSFFGLNDGLWGNYEQTRDEVRGNQTAAQEQNPWSYLGGQVAGGVAQGVASAPATLTANLTTKATPLLGRMLAGAGDGLIAGGAYGAGSGTDAQSRTVEALKTGLTGGFIGGLFPVASDLIGKGYQGFRNRRNAGPIAQQAGSDPDSLRLLGNVMDADRSLGPVGQANMTKAGNEAMLVDAGPNAAKVLDTAIQRGGPGAVDASEAISARASRSAQAITDSLDQNLGAPQGVTASRTAIRQGSAAARSSAYDDAYGAAINYADPRGQAIENIVKTRVPQSAIAEANALMRAEGHTSSQILAKVADDGSVVFERLPDVRQLDYITRGLNEVADQADGAGKLGGTTAKGRAYQNLSGEIRDTLKDLVPEYGKALETAADPIRRSKAVELGSKLLSPSMTRDQVDEAVRGMTGPEKEALAQGVRSRIDDVMANVTRTVQDDDVAAREAIKALKDLSSRASREKLTAAIGPEKATALFDDIDRAATSFNLRASVTENSKTYARQATDQMVKDRTAPGVIGKAGQGEGINATKRIVQMLTGQTPEKLRGKEDAIYSEIARLLTRQGGAGPDVYNAIGKLGKADQATQLMVDRISRALLSGQRLTYPAATQLTPNTGSR